MTTNAPITQQPDHTVAELLAAMVRILSGRPTKAAPGDLTITAVAIESGLKRHHLTHRHTDLKDLFYQLRDHHDNPVTHDATQLKSEVEDLKRRLGDANEQRRKWKKTAETFARAIEVLTLENAQLQQNTCSAPARPLTGVPTPTRGAGHRDP